MSHSINQQILLVWTSKHKKSQCFSPPPYCTLSSHHHLSPELLVSLLSILALFQSNLNINARMVLLQCKANLATFLSRMLQMLPLSFGVNTKFLTIPAPCNFPQSNIYYSFPVSLCLGHKALVKFVNTSGICLRVSVHPVVCLSLLFPQNYRALCLSSSSSSFSVNPSLTYKIEIE
jgi:hypothetical protein